ncbi:hypothetical protein OEW28_08740 [Defluviimonas sp. WL0002]|uniref:Uncharacterized protein n=1 Tax=Albidovulum marisflavi TaxID=2984159 RepID=A0ABT2ZC64_9RHOB|nr:hypothetical protein [Defluviimonas sp. WL0002]MCV2868714.1 hypothetical protein [Defluviimonas sp. WL0002]
MALLSRFREAMEAGRQAVATSDLRRTPEGVPPIPDATAALALGFDCETAQVHAALRQLGKITLLITASRDLALYQTPGIRTEFLPFTDSSSAPEPDSARVLYAARRLGTICEKWHISALCPLGSASEAGLLAMRASIARLPPTEKKTRLR